MGRRAKTFQKSARLLAFFVSECQGELENQEICMVSPFFDC